MKTFDLVVVGGGAAGLVVAGGAARLEVEVGLVEHKKLGGNCLHYGCVPSKALLHAAKVIGYLREGRTFGLDVPEDLPDFGKIMDYGRRVQAVLGEHDTPERFEEKGVRVIFGKPRFVSPTEMEVDGRKLGSKRFVLATGSRARVLPIPGLEEVGYITNVEVFGLRELPESLIILGGGPVAIELSQAFSRLGSRVTVLEKMSQILPREEPEAAQALQKILEGEGITFHTGIEIKRLEKQEGEKVVFLEKAGKEMRVQGKEVLVALGRSPELEGLNLEEAGVQFTEKGITVNAALRTTAKNIWACGDCIGGHLFTHVAEYEAGIVVRNAFSPLRKKADYGIVPRATFTDPRNWRMSGLRKRKRRKEASPM
ncbi:MAG: FAD-dependent oxidoreductase [Nitrospirae bacterium]|nr:FAD-dependent oxidoreductase [Nitrospirota bacterium]